MSLSKAPKGKIRIVNSGQRIQFYLRENSFDKNGKYVSKKEKALIKNYVQKSYDEKVLKILNEELSILSVFLEILNKRNISGVVNLDDIDGYLKEKNGNNFGRYTDINNYFKVKNNGKAKCNNAASLKSILKSNYISNGFILQIQKLYSDNPFEIKQFINPIDVSDEDYVNAWLNVEYVGKEIQDDLPYFETDHKERVRSKSELTIANALAKYGIPYKYECPFVLNNGIVIYPDFTVLDLKERKEIYWEHRGMMDDIDYARHAVIRNKKFMSSGVCVGKNLIITEETSDSPLGTNEIDTIIKENFL